MIPLVALLIIGFSSFTSGVAGFGMSLVAMPLLTNSGVPLEIAAPLMGLAVLGIKPLYLYRYFKDLNIRQIIPLSIAAAIGVPLGVRLLGVLDPEFVTSALGILVILFVLLNVFPIKLPAMNHVSWAYGLGFASGLLGGAYNLFGPPSIIYATRQDWSRATFKANMQTFGLINVAMIVLTHWADGNITPEVLLLFAMALPAVIIGLLLGFSLDRYINHKTFRRIVMVLLLLSGLRLLL